MNLDTQNIFYVINTIYIITVIMLLNRLLQHPNIVQLLGYTLSDTELILVMNLVEGHNLHKVLFGKLLIKVYCCSALANY